MVKEKNRSSTKEARENAEKALVRQYFDNKRNGIFLDIGANDPIAPESQSWHLEDKLDWSGVLVEPNPLFIDKCKKYRPNSISFNCAIVGDETEDQVVLYIPLLDGKEMDVHAGIGKNIDDFNYKKHREISVPGRTLNSILQETGIENVDLLSIDVEGAELDVLLGFDIMKYPPKLILLEDKHLYLTKHKYLKKHGYRLVKRTGFNFWYVPKDAKRPYQSKAEKIKILKRMYLSRWLKKITYSLRHKSLEPFKHL